MTDRTALGGANGDTNFRARAVRVRDDLSPAATLKTAIHELANAMLHAPERLSYHQERGRKEVEAESVAYVVLQHLGIGSDDYTLPYVAAWSGGKIEIVRDAAAAIIETAHAVIKALTADETLAADDQDLAD